MATIPDKKLAILDTTLRLITAQGFHATPMSQIAKEAGVAAGTIYHYFASKEELISELYSEVKDRMGRALITEVQQAPNYKAQFWVYWLNQYKFLVNNPNEFWFLEQFAVSPFIKQEDIKGSAHHYQMVLDFLEAGVNLGYLRNLSPDLMAYMLNAQVATIVKLQLTGHLAPTQETLFMVVQSSWDMIRTI